MGHAGALAMGMDALLHAAHFPNPEALTQWSSGVAGALVAATWQGTLLAAAVAVCLRWLPGISAAARSVIWLAVFVLVMWLHVGHSQAPVHAAPFHHDGLLVNARWSLALMGAWAMLSLVRGMQLMRSAVCLRRIAREAAPIKPTPACAALLRRVGRPVELCTSEAVDRPSVVGFFSSRILLPPSLMETLSDGELEQIVLHETEHLRRADDWTNLLQKVGLVVFPLNPALFWVEHRLCVERELACDDGVLRVTRAAKAYASCLTRLAEHALVQRGVSLALGAWERQSELAQRVHRILDAKRQGALSGKARLATGLLMLGLVGGTGELMRSPELVRFAAASKDAVAAQHTVDAEASILPAAEPGGNMVRARAVMAQPGAARWMPASMVTLRPAAARVPRPKALRVVRTANRTAVASEVRRPDSPGSSGIMLTDWRGTPVRAARLTFIVHEETLTSYAAVPYGDSWLILPL